MKKDITIIGGGLVGLAMALRLAKLDLNIALIDAKAFQHNPSMETDLRVYAINHASQNLLTHLQVWQLLSEQAKSAYRNMMVWDAGSDGVLDFQSQQLAKSELGHIIQEKDLKNALLTKLEETSNVCLVAPCSLKRIDISDPQVILEMMSGELIQSRLVIGADGANSWLRTQLDFECRTRSYSHHAIVCHIKTELSHQQTAYQIFTPEGPLAFLPLDDINHCSIVWSVPPNRAMSIMGLDDDAFLAELTTAFQTKLGKLTQLSKRVSFPLFERVVKPYIKDRVALVGDALHTIHPLAGLGMNLGLADVAALGNVIEHADNEFDSFKTLRRYERQRKGDVVMTTKLMKIIQKSFTPKGLPSSLRGFGMNMITHSPFLKQQIIQLVDG